MNDPHTHIIYNLCGATTERHKDHRCSSAIYFLYEPCAPRWPYEIERMYVVTYPFTVHITMSSFVFQSHCSIPKSRMSIDNTQRLLAPNNSRIFKSKLPRRFNAIRMHIGEPDNLNMQINVSIESMEQSEPKEKTDI